MTDSDPRLEALAKWLHDRYDRSGAPWSAAPRKRRMFYLALAREALATVDAAS